MTAGTLVTPLPLQPDIQRAFVLVIRFLMSRMIQGERQASLCPGVPPPASPPAASGRPSVNSATVLIPLRDGGLCAGALLAWLQAVSAAMLLVAPQVMRSNSRPTIVHAITYAISPV